MTKTTIEREGDEEEGMRDRMREHEWRGMCEAIWHRKSLLLAFSLSCINVLLTDSQELESVFKVLIGTCLAQSLCGLWEGLALLGRINRYGIGAKCLVYATSWKMKILSFIPPRVVPKMYDFLLWCLEEYFSCFCLYNASQKSPKQH